MIKYNCDHNNKNLNLSNIKQDTSRFTKSKIRSLYIDPNEINKDNLYDLIISNLKTGVTYSLLFKIKYNDLYFGMLGCQVGFILSNMDDYKSIQKLLININRSIKEFVAEYSVEHVDLLQILYVTISDVPKLKLKNINDVKLNKEFMSVKDGRFNFNSRLLPLSVNMNHYGKILFGEDRSTFLNIINKEKNVLLHKEKYVKDIDSMFLYNNQYIILNKKLSDIIISREVYDADTGKYKDTFIDTILNNKVFYRNKGKVIVYISEDKVIHINATKDLAIIKYSPKAYSQLANYRIGTIDLEAYDDTDGYSKVYALGFVVSGENPYTYYIDEFHNSDKLFLKCFDDILVNKYNEYIFYIHNFKGYDSVFILNILKRANIDKGFEYYKLEPLYRDNKIFRLDIKVRKELGDRKQHIIGARKEPTFNKITIIDSYSLLNDNLFDLSRSFDIDITKGYFPHKFVNKNTFNYIGNTPSINYWDKISIEDYNMSVSKVWSLKDECLKYLNKDLVSLLNIMETFNRYIFRTYDIQMTESSTISRLALNIFLKYYLKGSQLPVIKSNMYKDIKEGYFGGVTEVYKPYGKNLYYYDVNSLYPFSSINYIPGKVCMYVEDFTSKGLILDKLFGFFYCEIETNNGYIGLLPVRGNDGVSMPIGKWSGWYFSEEIKFAEKQGYNIKVFKGYNFDKQTEVFDKYVNDLYKIKSKSEGHIRVITKSLLNNLLGRFGMDINKPKTEIVNADKLEEILSTRIHESYPKQITDDDYLISYYPEISKSICESHGKDYLKVYTNSSNNIDMEKNKQFSDVSISTSAAITSYSRIFMSKIKLDILRNNGEIYYTDTDSIVTNVPLSDDLVGDKLGQFKLEHKVKEAYFISSKTYCLILDDNSCKIKVKGAYKTSLTIIDFMSMYLGIDVEAKKRNTITNYEKGSVSIRDKEIHLSSNSYKKRDKVYIGNIWVDTKPLVHNP